MPDDMNDTLANSPKDPVTGKVKTSPGPSDRPGTEADDIAGRNATPDKGAPPAGQRNTAYPGKESEDGEHADHETEEAAAYRENDA